MQRAPEPAVVSWLDSRPAESIWTTSITVFEVQTGLELLDPGRRRQQLEDASDQLLADELEGRVQPFDQPAAIASGRIGAERQRAGRPVEIGDVQIAGITSVRRATLATRTTRRSEATGINLVSPWAP